MVLSLQDQASAKLRRVNALMDESTRKMRIADRLAQKNTQTWMYSSAAFEKSLASSAYFFAQVDRIEREAMIKSRFQHSVTQKLALSYSRLKEKVSSYASTLRSRLTQINSTIQQHRTSLMMVSAALSGMIGLTIRGAVNEEKFRRNIESLSSVIDYNHEGWQNINKALQEYIDSAAKVNYISKENRARLVSEMITMGTAKDTILKYGPTLEKLGVSLGKTTDEVITAVRSSLAGFHIAFKRLGVMLKEEDIKKKIEEIRDAHKGWSEEALRAEAIMELAYPQMVARIGDFDKAMDSAYGDLVKFKEKLNDLTGDIGSIYIPYLRTAVEWTSKFIKFLKVHPILKTAIAFGTLATVIAILGGLALPKAYSGVKSFLSISKTAAKFIWSRMIPATVAQAYATGGLTAALRAAALGFKSLAVAMLTNPITWAILGIVAAVLLLQHAWVHNIFGLRDKTLAFFKAIRGAIDWVVGGIKTLITWITAIPSRIQEAWRSLTENPLFKLAQTALSFTPVGMGLTAAKMITGAPLLSISSTSISTVQGPTYVTHQRTVHIPKVDIKIQGVTDPKKAAKLAIEEMTDQLRRIGV